MRERNRNKIHDFTYFFTEGVSNMFTHGFMSFAAIGITVACLLIMGTFSLVAVNANETLSRLEDENQVLAFVDESLTDAQARALEDDLLAVPNVSRVEFIDRDQAWTDYIADFPEIEELAGDEMDSSTLRHRYAIYMDDLSLMSETKTLVENVPGVAWVNGYEELSDGFITLRNIATIISVTLIAILFLVSVFIIANTIKLTTFDRREEIAIMKMVGATNGFIRWPFVYEGLLMGLLSALIAFFLQWGLYHLVTGGISSNDLFSIIQIVPFSSLWGGVALVFAGAGIFIGVGGSLSAIRQFLKV